MSGRSGEAMEHAGRRVVLHADDFGMNTSVTDGILRAFEHGLLTSTSVLGNGPDASRGLQQWHRLEEDRRDGRLPSSVRRRRLSDPDRPFDLGIHLNLTQGRPLTAGRYPAELLDGQGRFPGIYALFRRLCLGGSKFRPAIEEELTHQIRFVLDHGIEPTHLNGHHYVEMAPVVAKIVPGLLEQSHIRVVRSAVEHRWLRSGLAGRLHPGQLLSALVHQSFARRFRTCMARLSMGHPDTFCGISVAGRIDMRWIRIFLSHKTFRLAEIGIHPGNEVARASPREEGDGWHDPLASGRSQELRLLASAELADYLEQQSIRLGRLANLDIEQRRSFQPDLA
jgi:chitin disaccharide deacetylase